MNAPRLHISLLLLVVCSLQTIWAQEAVPTAGEVAPASEIDTQLRINRTTLLESKAYSNRIDVASLLLSSEDPAARAILLDVLKRTDNPTARAAVCEALNPTRAWKKPLKNKEDFIKPLLDLITSQEDFAIAKPAADATLLFEYSQLQQELEKAVTDPSLSINIRKNVIYAMRRHPDKRAVAKLISLFDSAEPQIVEAARTELASVGISVSPDPAVRRQVLAELQQRGAEAFLRERLVRQETRMRGLEAERDVWRSRYLAALGNVYDSRPDDAAKNAFLAQQLSAPELAVKLWALDKLDELRQGTGNKPKLAEFGATLMGLVSDPSGQVRLNTARLLARMGEPTAAKPLLDQLKVEQDEQVRREILVALREACYAGSLATAAHKVPEEVRIETLEWAAKFLNEPDAERARIGAEVIGKLLEQNGLKAEDVGRYLTMLAERYVQASAGTDVGLRGHLLGVMAALCVPRSTCREQAAELFVASFEQAITDKADTVRQKAVDGLVNIDKPAALKRLRDTLANDPSPVIRLKLIDLVGDAGAAQQDLVWLCERLGVAGESEPAWQAMLKIFRRLDSTVLADWTVRINAPTMSARVAPEQRISFFTIVEQKAQAENKAGLLREAQRNLAQLYLAGNSFKQAAECVKALLATTTDERERQALQAQLLRLYLTLSSMDLAAGLISECLAAENPDLGPSGFLVKSVEEYLNSTAAADPGVLLKALEQVKAKDPETARLWRALLSRWAEGFAKAKKLENSDRASN